MAGFKVVGGPDGTPLHRALARYETLETVRFVLQFLGSTSSMVGKPFSQDFLVEKLSATFCDRDWRDVTITAANWEVDALTLTGRYNFEDHSGKLELEGELQELPVQWLGVKLKVWKPLVESGATTLGNVLDMNEIRLCEAMVGDLYGEPITETIAVMAVDCFERLRNRLDALSYELPGQRHSTTELVSALL